MYSSFSNQIFRKLETFCSIQCGKCIIVNDRIFFPMFLTGFTNHLLITFHLRRCQYHIKVINDLRQFCITVGFRVYIIPLGFSCFSCPLSRYKLYPLSDDCWEELIPRARGKSTAHFGLTILCGTNTSIATFELTLTPSEEHENRRNLK